MAPWTPSYTASDMLVSTNADTNNAANNLVLNYVTALGIRRRCHTAGALFSGRQPIQNAMVPGGVTTLFSSTYPLAVGTTDATDPSGYDSFGPFNAATIQSQFATLWDSVRQFIDTTYIPDVVTVATVAGFQKYWSQGIGCGRFLAYGDYPQDNSGKLAVKRGIVDTNVSGWDTALTTFDQANIKEYVGGSYYNYGVLDDLGLHPFDGKTTPNMNDGTKVGGYSWIKAPRYGSSAQVCEVGPLARMLVSYVSPDQSVKVDSLNTTLVLPVIADVTLTNPYSINDLVGGVVTSLAGTFAGADATILVSALGRHAARALEAKFVADAVAAWAASLTPDAPCYTYAKIPKQISTGYGLTEAPRGALGHWIKIEGKKVAKYQCVVPSTWNFSPSSNGTDRGAVEQSLINSTIGTTPTDQIINILRLVHPWDCCIACAVHVVNPEGKETLKFAIGPDGKPSNVEIKG